MLFEPFRLNITPDIFDVHFRDYVQKLGRVIFDRHQVGEVRIRYDMYYRKKEPTENDVLFAEVEITKVIQDQVEVRVAINEVDKHIAYDFVPGLGHFIDDKWHAQLVLDDYDSWDLRKGLDNKIEALMEKWGIKNLEDLSSPIDIPEGLDEQERKKYSAGHEIVRESFLRELQAGLPPIPQSSIKIDLLEKLIEPQKPERTDGWANWLKYFHAMKNAGRKYTLHQLADDSGYSYSTIRKRHIGCPECQK